MYSGRLLKLNPSVNSFIIVATIIKIVLILFFYQHIIVYDNGEAKIAHGYAWDELIESMNHGKYEITVQHELSDLYHLKSRSARPPLYSLLLYLISHLGIYAGIAAVTIQSIITSLIAFFGYKIVFAASNNRRMGMICAVVLLFFPMNVLKSGTIDDAPLMLLFLLSSVFYLSRWVREGKDKYGILAGCLLGLAMLTRTIILPIIMAIVLCLIFLLIKRKISVKGILYFVVVFMLTVSPWLIRNYIVYDQVVISTGNTRLSLIYQSEEFIQMFPHSSIDEIEKVFLRKYHATHPYLSELGEIQLEKEFGRLAFLEMKEHPGKFLRSLLVKFKVFLPTQSFPDRENNGLKNLFYLASYLPALICFIWALFRVRLSLFQETIFLVLILCYSSVGIIYALMSRHFYPLIIFMYIFFLLVIARRFGKGKTEPEVK